MSKVPEIQPGDPNLLSYLCATCEQILTPAHVTFCLQRHLVPRFCGQTCRSRWKWQQRKQKLHDQKKLPLCSVDG